MPVYQRPNDQFSEVPNHEEWLNSVEGVTACVALMYAPCIPGKVRRIEIHAGTVVSCRISFDWKETLLSSKLNASSIKRLHQ